MTTEELSKRLNKNGWTWHLISNLTPGVVRIQLGSEGNEENGWRKCIEASSIEQAVVKAERFVENISIQDYENSLYRNRGE